MRKIVTLLVLSLCLLSCDDGDIITVSLDFDESFSACGDLVFYKTKENPFESISLLITSPSLTVEDLIETDGNGNLTFTETELNIGSANLFNYRSYNASPEGIFCTDIPPSNIVITNDSFSTTGTATISTILIEDDNDGVPADMEDNNTDGDNDPSTDPTDTDGDGIPNYLDADDDGDNVLTLTELADDNDDGDNNPLTNPRNTDGTDLPNYLDTDDDNDGVLTRDEENDTQDQDPSNDRTDTNPDNANLADYLNIDIANTIPATAYRAHVIQQDFVVNIIIYNIQLPNLSQNELDFGTLQDSRTSSSRSLTPNF